MTDRKKLSLWDIDQELIEQINAKSSAAFPDIVRDAELIVMRRADFPNMAIMKYWERMYRELPFDHELENYCLNQYVSAARVFADSGESNYRHWPTIKGIGSRDSLDQPPTGVWIPHKNPVETLH